MAADIEARLGALPATLEGSYWEIYQEIQSSGDHAAALADLAFQWLMYARETLTADVFTRIASSTLPSGTASGFAAAEVIDVCANLIVSRNGAFEFAHLSVREFLEGIHKRKVDRLLPVHGNAAIATACLRLLHGQIELWVPKTTSEEEPATVPESTHLYSQIKLEISKMRREAESAITLRESTDSLESNGDSDEQDKAAETEAVLYAAQNWVYHICKSGDMRPKDPLAELIRTFLITDSPDTDAQSIVSEKFRMWCRIMNNTRVVRPAYFDSSETERLNDSFSDPPNPIWLACLHDWPEVVEFLYTAKHEDIDTPRCLSSFSSPDTEAPYETSRGLSPLWYTLLSRRIPLMKIILSQCPDPLQRHGSAYVLVTPLERAAREGDEECTKVLLRTEHGGLDAEVEAFSAAASNGHLKILELLLAHNAKLSSTAGHDAMCKACAGGRTDAVIFLLDHGVPTTKDMQFLCSAVPTHELLKVLLDRGIGLGGLSKALTLSVSEDYKESTALLLSHGAQKEPHAVTRSVKDGCRKTAIRLIEAGYNISGRYLERRRAPLHYAAEQGYHDVAVVLLSAGAPATTYDRDEKTPLHLAAAGGHDGCVELLLSHGADVLAEDPEGRIPLDLAEMKRHESTESIIRNWMTKLMDELQREKQALQTTGTDKEEGGEAGTLG